MTTTISFPSPSTTTGRIRGDRQRLTTTAESSTTQRGRPDSATAASPRARPTGTGLFVVAVVAVVAAFVASIVFLVGYEPGGAGVTTMSWPAATAGMVGLFSAVAGLVLAFLASVRTDSV